MLAAACADPASAPQPRRAGVSVAVAAGKDTLWIAESTSLILRIGSTVGQPGTRAVANVAWTSSDTTAVTVDYGSWDDTSAVTSVHGRAGGRATLTATVLLRDSSTATATATITVRPVAALAVWPDTNAIVPGVVRQLTARDMLSANYVNYPSVAAGVRWATDAPTVAAVDDGGRVTAVAAGRATITATITVNAVERRASAVVVVRSYPAPLAFTSLVSASTNPLYPLTTTHTCGLTVDSRAYCWGEGASGNLGTAGATDRCETVQTSIEGHTSTTTRETFRCSAVPVEVDGGLRFAQLSTYGSAYVPTFHTCGVTTAGDVYCWGQNSFGQLGTGGVTSSAVPQRADASVRFRAVSVGSGFTCALAVDGTPYCWGQNNPELGELLLRVPGLLGTGDTAAVVSLPRPVVNAPPLVSITTGDTHACGLTVDGTAWCWGDNIAGQLGNGRPVTDTCPSLSDTACYAFALHPTRVAGATAFREVRAGHNSTCALDAAGALWCWGLTGLGTKETVFAGLADGLVSRVPARFTGTPAFTSLASPPWGDVQFPRGSCGLGLDGALSCFSHSAVTTDLAGPAALRFTQVASPGWPAYGSAACGIATDGFAYCWHPAAFGARGDGQLTSAADLTGVAGRVAGQR